MSTPSKLSFRDPRVMVMGLSLLASLLMLVGKGIAFWITSSTAILSDFAESAVHLFATAFAAFSLWYAATPADTSHPYGHGKVSYFAAGIEGALILVAALGIFYSAGYQLVVGPELTDLGLGLLIIGGLAMVNLLLGLSLVEVGERYQNLVLISNGRHVLADMWTSLGVVLGVGAVWLTGWVWLDPVVAVLIGVHLLWAGGGLINRGVRGLMETVNQEETDALIATLDDFTQKGVITGFHQVRHRRVENTVWVEYHLHFPSEMPLNKAHARSHQVEDVVQAIFGDATVYVTAHLEPAAHDAAHPEHHTEPADPLRRPPTSFRNVESNG